MAELTLPESFNKRRLRRNSGDTTLTSTADSIFEKESADRKFQCRDNGSFHKSNETSTFDEDATKSSKKKSRSARSKILRMFSRSTSLKASVELIRDESYSLRKNKNNRKRIPSKWRKSAPVVFKRKGTVEGLSRVENKCTITTNSSLREISQRRREAKTRGVVFEIDEGAIYSSDDSITSIDHAFVRASTTRLATASSSITNHGQTSTDIETKEETGRLDEAITIDRAAIRLDGIEVYAMVSALTIATSVSLFDLHRGEKLNWLDDLFQNGEYVSLITGVCVLCASVSTILLGLHATLIFSLMTMYGRTAVGLGNDDGYSEFFQKTAHIRYGSFRSFHWSLYSFLVQVILTMLEKVPVEFRLVFGPCLMFFCCSIIYGDTENIIHLASKILFKPREKKN